MSKVFKVSRQYEIVEAETQAFYITEDDVQRYITETGYTLDDWNDLFVWCTEQKDLEPEYYNYGDREETPGSSVYEVEVRDL